MNKSSCVVATTNNRFFLSTVIIFKALHFVMVSFARLLDVFFTLSNSCFDLAVNQNRIYIQSMIVLFLIKSVKQSKSPVLMTGPVLIIHDLQIKHIPGLPVYALR